LLRHADRVRIACQAQLVNVIAPIMTRAGGGAWPQTIFHPFAQVTKYAAGEVLLVEPDVPGYEDDLHGHVPYLEAVATYDADAGAATLLCVNRSQDEPLQLDVDVRGLGDCRLVEATTLSDPDIRTTNTEEAPERVAPRTLDDVTTDEGRVRALLPPVSWSVIRLTTDARRSTSPTDAPH
jgi:alpha-N-arabinofuranosidase